jgi:hypothetical protein
MRARLLSSEHEEGGLVVLAVGDEKVYAMDCLGYSAAPYPEVGETFDVEFRCLHSDHEDWESFFAGNIDGTKKLERIGHWSYRVLGTLTAVDSPGTEALVDCGICTLPAPIEIQDEACLGKYVGFEIQRLDAWRKE